jgi:hypothetical protein
MKDSRGLRPVVGKSQDAQKQFLICFVCGVLVFVGCSQDGTKKNLGSESSTSNIDGSKFLLTGEPSGGADVIKVLQTSIDSDEVVIVGRIGGSENPWVDGRAAFSIVDLSLKSCLECGSEGCLKPWDYC